jgi:hypothetical protein
MSEEYICYARISERNTFIIYIHHVKALDSLHKVKSNPPHEQDVPSHSACCGEEGEAEEEERKRSSSASSPPEHLLSSWRACRSDFPRLSSADFKRATERSLYHLPTYSRGIAFFPRYSRGFSRHRCRHCLYCATVIPTAALRSCRKDAARSSSAEIDSAEHSCQVHQPTLTLGRPPGLFESSLHY